MIVDRLLAGIDRPIVRAEELPLVGVGAQGQLEDAELVEARVLAVRRVLGAPGKTPSTGPDDEHAGPARIGNLVRPLRREPLVMVGVAIEDQLRTRGIHLVPQPARFLGVAMRTRSPARAVPHRDDRLEAPCGEILAEPLQLRRVRVLVDFAIERDQVPSRVGERHAEVAFLRRAGAVLPEVGEVGSGRGGAVIVVARTGIRAPEEVGLAPGRRVEIAVLVVFAAVVGIVPEREDDRARVFLENAPRQRRGGLRARVLARRPAHVADGDDDLFRHAQRENWIERITLRNTFEYVLYSARGATPMA